MIKWVIGIIITFIGIIVIPLYFHFLAKAELKYTISSAMTIETSLGEQNWQLITINNTGNREANRIKIKVDSKILDYKVIPFLQTDKFEGKLSPKALDIEYTSLPPQGTIEIRVSLPTSESVINRKINIVHESGVATTATSKDKMIAFIITMFLLTILIAPIIFLIISDIIYNLYELRSDACNVYYALSILKRKKPFFLSQTKWTEIREVAINNAFKEDPCYQDRYRAFLNEEKPDYLNHEEYEQLTNSVSKKYAKTYWDKWVTYDNNVIEKLINHYKTKHPKNLTIQSEKEIDAEAIIIFKEEFGLKMPHVYDSKEIESQYYQVDCSILPENVINSIKNTLRNYYPYSLERKILSMGYVENLSELCDSNILAELNMLNDYTYKINMAFISDLTNEDNIEKISKSPKPNWMKDYDYTKLKEIAEKILNLDELLKDTKKKETKTIENNSKAEKSKDECDEKIKIINAELRIIDDLFKDPNSIKKVEDYNNPFASGNFENLKKLSEILLKS